MAKNGIGCKVAPEVNGQPSLLYTDLYNMLVKQFGLEPSIARQLTNVMYSYYKADNQIQQSLDNTNKPKNKQDEHSALDVFQILKGDELVKYTQISQLNTLSISEGIKLDLVQDVEFDSWQQAYQKAQNINSTYSSVSAFVKQNGDKYVIKINSITPLNRLDRVYTQIEGQQMQLIENFLNVVGTSTSNLSFVQNKFFGRRYYNLVNWIANTRNTNPKYLLKEDLKMLVSLFQRESVIDRLITKFGSIDSLVDTYYDYYRGNYNATPSTDTQLRAAMDLMINFNGLDTSYLAKSSKDLTDTIKANDKDYEAYMVYDELNDQFEIDQTAIQVSKDNLTSLSKILQYAVKSLGIEANALKKSGDISMSSNLLKQVQKINSDLERKEYISSLAEFLNIASTRLSNLLNELKIQIPQDASIEYLQQRGSILREAAQYIEVYGSLIKSIATLDAVDKDIFILDNDAQVLQKEANNISQTISNINLAIQQSIDQWARQALASMLGEHSEITINDVMKDINYDASYADRLYNATQVSHIPTAVLANYIQSARRTRTAKLAEIAQRISVIVNPIGADGKRHTIDTSFMYELVEAEFSSKGNPKQEYLIISEYDFEGFYAVRRKFYGKLKNRGLTGAALELEMENWMIHNTEEVVVDKKTGRTERLPKLKKKNNPLDNLTPEQRTAYDKFIELKAEIDSLLPGFAQHLYSPPQLRKNAIDQLFKGNISKAVKEKYEDTIKVREDEENLGQSVETDSGEIIVQRTDMTGSTDVIPINYVNKLRNQDDLLLNFAEGLQHLAASAVNYESINNIVDTVEVLSDYIESKVSPTKTGAALAQGYLYGSKLFFELKKGSRESRISNILRDQKKRLLYNNTTADLSPQAAKKYALIRKITSINALTFNLFGAINNAIEGYRKNLEESLVFSSDTFDLADLEWAHMHILKDHVGKTGSHLLDFFSGRRTSLGGLIMDRFDPRKEKFHEIANTKYRTNLFRTAISKDLTMIGYSIGETLNNMPIVYARLHHIKVLIDSKEGRLIDALERVDNGDGTYSLGIKSNTTLKDSGEPVTEEYLDQVAREINEISERSHGGMSEEAMGAFAQGTLGIAVLQLRRWMIGVYSNYFRGQWYDAATGKRKEGAWKGIYDVSFAPIISAVQKHLPWSKEFVQDTNTFKQDLLLNYNNLKPHQKLAAVRWLVATSMMTVLSILTDALIKSFYTTDKDEEWFKLLFYFLTRQKMDVSSTVPDLNHIENVGSIGKNLIEIMDKPFAAYSTVKFFTYPVTGLPDYGTEIQSGPHKGEDRYVRNLKKLYWKPGELWNRIEGLDSTDELINSLGGLQKYSAKKEYEKLTGEEVKDNKSSKKKTTLNL